MMAKDYSGLSPRDVLSGANLSVDGGIEVLAGSPWTSNQILSIDQTVISLQKSGSADNILIGESIQNLKVGVYHPTFTREANECIEAIYNLSPLDGQIRAIAQLLGHDDIGHNFLDIISKLFQEGGCLLGKLLGEQGKQRLLQVATQSNPKTQTNLLVTWAKEGIAPKNEEDKGYYEHQIQSNSSSDGTGPRYAEPDLMIDATMAVTMNDSEGFTNILQSLSANQVALTSIELVEAIVDRMGEDARPFLQDLALNSPDTTIRETAAHGLMYSTEGHASLSAQSSANVPGGFGFGSSQENKVKPEISINGFTDLSSLESILNTPGIIPSTLAANIGFTPAVQAQLLKYIVSKCNYSAECDNKSRRKAKSGV